MADRAVVWQFGESEADAVAWMQSPAMLHAYVDFRTPETPPGMWERAMVVTRAWVERQVSEGSGCQSWPSLIVVPDAGLTAARRSIELLLADGGWRVAARNAFRIRDADRRSDM